MNLQEKTLFVLVVSFVAVMIFITIFVSGTLIASYSNLEKSYVEKDLQQVLNKVQDDSDSLSSVASDWGPRNDTYNFVIGNQPDYISSNLVPETYDNLRVNFIIITNLKGDIAYAGAYDARTHTMVPVPGALLGQLDRENPLMNMSNPRGESEGILMLSGTPVLVASRPVVHADFSGNPQGVVIMGRYLDQNEMNRLSPGDHVSLKIIPATDASLPAEVTKNLQEEPGSEPEFITPINSSYIAGFALIRDIYGSDAAVVETVQPRDILVQGLTTTMQFILIILGAFALLGVIVIVMIDRFVLSRLGFLSQQVRDLGTAHEPDQRLRLTGDDELSGLATDINLMLEKINETRRDLQHSEVRFRELAEHLPLIFFEMDTVGHLRYINKTGADLFQISDDDITKGVNIRHYLSPENIDRMERGLAAVLSGAPSPGEIYTLKQPDGRVMKAMVHTSLIRREGRVIGFRGVVVDLTERIRLKEQLEENTKLLGGILQASPVGVFRMNPTGNILFINDMFTKITGIPFEDIRGKYWADILPLEDKETLLRTLSEEIRQKKMIGAESRFVHPNGSVYWLYGQVVPIVTSSNVLEGWVGTITDITERKNIELALAESENKYRTLAENSSDILFSTDIKGVITYISPMVNRYGYLAEEVVSRPIERFIYPADREEFLKGLLRELSGGEPIDSSFRMLDKWGYIHWIEEKSTIIVDQNGQVIGVNGVLRDFTDRRRAEDAVMLANKKLNLLNNITRHDILNTITALLGCVDMANATKVPAEREELLGQIKELIRVVQRQIEFTREYQSVGVTAPRWQNIREIVKLVIVNFSGSGIAFADEIEDIEVYADPLLEKVFYNLIDNAIRYGENIGIIRFYYQISDEGLALICEDDGIGIPDNEKERIFERGIGRNTGMGLFLTREILLITGITIRETGRPGCGARFEMLIPNGAFRFVRENTDKKREG
ncbi:MAG: PAS domain S-box protein [Methanoregula sp.]